MPRRAAARPPSLLATGGYGQLYATHHQPGRRPPATASRSPCGPAPRWPTWSSCSSTRRSLLRRADATAGARWSPRPCAARARCCSTGPARRFMTGVHPLADLAPRDVVAAAITRAIAETGADYVYLDATGVPRFATRFPTVSRPAGRAGIDPVREPDPGHARRALRVRRRGHRPARAHRRARPVRGGRGRAHRPARRQPARVEQPARRAGRGRRAARRGRRPTGGRCRGAGAPAVRRSRRLPVAPPGRRAARDDRGRRDRPRRRGPRRRLGRRARPPRGPGCPTSRAEVEDAALTLLAQAVLAAAGTRTETRGLPRAHRLPRRATTHWQRREPACSRSTRPGTAVVRRRPRHGGSGGMTALSLGTASYSTTSPGRRHRAARRTCATAPTPPPRPPCRPDAVAVGEFAARRPGCWPGCRPCARCSTSARADWLRGARRSAPTATGSPPGESALAVRAPVRGLLTAERTALNLLCHLSGVATATRGVGRRRRGHAARASATPARPCPGCGCWRSTPCAAAAAATTASASATRS